MSIIGHFFTKKVGKVASLDDLKYGFHNDMEYIRESMGRSLGMGGGGVLANPQT